MNWKAILIGLIFYTILGLTLGNSKEDLRIPVGDSDLILDSGLMFTIISAILGGVVTAFVAKDKFIKHGILTGLIGGILIGIFLVVIVVYFPVEARILFPSPEARELLRANIEYLFLITTAMFTIVGITGSTIGSLIGKYVIKKKYHFILTLAILFSSITVVAYAIHPIVLLADFEIESIELLSAYSNGTSEIIGDIYIFNKTQSLVNVKWTGKTVENIKKFKGEGGEGYCGQIGLTEFEEIEDMILNNVNSWKEEYPKPPSLQDWALYFNVYVYLNIYTNKGIRKTSFTLKDASVPDSLQEVVEKLIDIGKSVKGSCV